MSTSEHAVRGQQGGSDVFRGPSHKMLVPSAHPHTTWRHGLSRPLPTMHLAGLPPAHRSYVEVRGRDVRRQAPPRFQRIGLFCEKETSGVIVDVRGRGVRALCHVCGGAGREARGGARCGVLRVRTDAGFSGELTELASLKSDAFRLCAGKNF